MNSPQTLEYVISHQIAGLENVLRQWIQMMAKYCVAWEWKDVPWWYGERACVSLLAGAVWRTDNIALEEYVTTKFWQAEANGQKENYAGRCDLYLKIGEQEFSAEAKCIWPRVTVDNPDPTQEIKETLRKVKREAESNEPSLRDRERPLALVFVVPEIPQYQYSDLDIILQKWVEAVKTVNCSAMAWSFPIEAQSQKIRDNGYHYPGVALFILN